MRLMKTFSIGVLLNLGLATSVFATADVYFSPRGGIREAIISELGNAEKSIDIAMYSFDDSKITAQVKKIAAEGIKVRLILNQAQRSPEKSRGFEEAGIDVRYVNMIMHHKFAIVDGPKNASSSTSKSVLMSGSYNWSASAENIYDEDFVVFRNENEKLLAFQAEFNLMWNKARDFEGPASSGEQSEEFEISFDSISFTSENFRAVETPTGWSFRSNVALEDGIAGLAIIAAIDSAQTSVQIASAHFRRSDIADALIRAMDRGVKVEMLLDGQEFDAAASGDVETNSKHLDEALATQGADVRYKSYSRYWDYRSAKQMHSKYIVVDASQVLTGSFNWSENAELKTFENLISLGSAQAKVYEKNFQKIFNYGLNDFEALLEEVETSEGRGPCVYEPISLSAAQIKTLRKGYARNACR